MLRMCWGRWVLADTADTDFVFPKEKEKAEKARRRKQKTGFASEYTLMHACLMEEERRTLGGVTCPWAKSSPEKTSHFSACNCWVMLPHLVDAALLGYGWRGLLRKKSSPSANVWV